jgi:hypothetical protein
MGKKFIVSPEVLKALSIAMGAIPTMQSDWDFTTLPPKASSVNADPKLDNE